MEGDVARLVVVRVGARLAASVFFFWHPCTGGDPREMCADRHRKGANRPAPLRHGSAFRPRRASVVSPGRQPHPGRRPSWSGPLPAVRKRALNESRIRRRHRRHIEGAEIHVIEEESW